MTAPASPVRYVLPDETCFDDEGKIPFLVATAPASQELVDHVLTAPTEGNDGRSEWLWIRLPNGDLILGVYPQGDTYMEVEGEASF
jgi:hypothetical protein